VTTTSTAPTAWTGVVAVIWVEPSAHGQILDVSETSATIRCRFAVGNIDQGKPVAEIAASCAAYGHTEPGPTLCSLIIACRQRDLDARFGILADFGCRRDALGFGSNHAQRRQVVPRSARLVEERADKAHLAQRHAFSFRRNE